MGKRRRNKDTRYYAAAAAAATTAEVRPTSPRSPRTWVPELSAFIMGAGSPSGARGTHKKGLLEFKRPHNPDDVKTLKENIASMGLIVISETDQSIVVPRPCENIYELDPEVVGPRNLFYVSSAEHEKYGLGAPWVLCKYGYSAKDAGCPLDFIDTAHVAVPKRLVSSLKQPGAAYENIASFLSQNATRWCQQISVHPPPPSENIPDTKVLTDLVVRQSVLDDQLQVLRQQDSSSMLWTDERRYPTFRWRNSILDAILSTNQVTFIRGASGCGRSTQVPSYILQTSSNSSVNIFVAEPRAIDVKMLTSRVANELGEKVGDTVGYELLSGNCRSSKTCLTFMTASVLLRQLVSDPLLSNVTHVILDEVHERTLDIDFCLVLLRDLIAERRDLKIVIMSSTFDGMSLQSYFGNLGAVVEIPLPTQRVQEFWLEDILELTKFNLSEEAMRKQIESNTVLCSRFGSTKGAAASTDSTALVTPNRAQCEKDLQRFGALSRKALHYSIDTLVGLANWWEKSDPLLPRMLQMSTTVDLWELQLIVSVLEHIWVSVTKHVGHNFRVLEKSGGNGGKKAERAGFQSVVVFLPSLADITNLQERLEQHPIFGQPEVVNIVTLFSPTCSLYQKSVFAQPTRGVWKIVLTNIITEAFELFDDIVYVIDTGKTQEDRFDPTTNVPSSEITWTSKTKISDRRALAGRVSTGKCYHLFPKSFCANQLSLHTPPEVLRTPLEDVYVKAQALFDGRVQVDGKPSNNVDVVSFLAKCPDSPTSFGLDTARMLLRDMGVLKMCPASSDQNMREAAEVAGSKSDKLTDLGRVLARLSVNCRIGKLLLYGIFFRCLDPILTIAAVLLYDCDLFIKTYTLQEKRAVTAAKDRLSKTFERDVYRDKSGGAISDHLLAWKVYSTWVDFSKKGVGTYRERDEQRQKWCKDNSVDSAALRHVSKIKQELLSNIRRSGMMLMAGSAIGGAGGDVEEKRGRAGEPSERMNTFYNKNANELKIVLAVLATGLYPCIARVTHKNLNQATPPSTPGTPHQNHEVVVEEESEDQRKRKRESSSDEGDDVGDGGDGKDGKDDSDTEEQQAEHDEPGVPTPFTMHASISSQFFKCFTPHSNVPITSGGTSSIKIPMAIERWVVYFRCGFKFTNPSPTRKDTIQELQDIYMRQFRNLYLPILTPLRGLKQVEVYVKDGSWIGDWPVMLLCGTGDDSGARLSQSARLELEIGTFQRYSYDPPVCEAIVRFRKAFMGIFNAWLQLCLEQTMDRYANGDLGAENKGGGDRAGKNCGGKVEGSDDLLNMVNTGTEALTNALQKMLMAESSGEISTWNRFALLEEIKKLEPARKKRKIDADRPENDTAHQASEAAETPDGHT
ncbi:ATPdependent RNA helicase [Quaeritorhiza haematococci]|nr:ATPdependent RNA helicase [Quaeritorhiza haematococci]